MNLRKWMISSSQIDILLALNKSILQKGTVSCIANVITSDEKSAELDDKCTGDCLSCLCDLLDEECMIDRE